MSEIKKGIAKWILTNILRLEVEINYRALDWNCEAGLSSGTVEK